MSKRRLLLADDSVTIQKVVNLTFADEDIEVIAVGDGDAAMEKIAESRPDLILADVNMPGLDGYRICETIKQSEETKNIPVILLVGSFEPFDEAEAQRVGADDFLTKPFQSIRQLVNRVSDLLDDDKADASDDKVVNSFDDTLEMEKREEEPVSVESLGDAGEDDKMIETSQIGNVSTDETQKFESEPMSRSSVDDIDFASLKQPYNYQSIEEYEAENDWAKTQPLSETDLNEITTVLTEDETFSLDDKVDDLADEKKSVADTEQNKISQASPPIESAPAFYLDDLDILELPQSKTKSFAPIELQDKSNQKTATNKIAAEQTGRVSVADQIENLSPETLEAIADRISEKIFDKVVEKITNQIAMKK